MKMDPDGLSVYCPQTFPELKFFFFFFFSARYLHEVCLPSVVHRNFKSANILLDEELNSHLSDCGLAALTPNTERQVNQ